jgi:hypothetical protein
MEEYTNPNEDFDLFGSFVELKCSWASFFNCFSIGTDGSEIGGVFGLNFTRYDLLEYLWEPGHVNLDRIFQLWYLLK